MSMTAFKSFLFSGHDQIRLIYRIRTLGCIEFYVVYPILTVVQSHGALSLLWCTLSFLTMDSRCV